MSQKSAKRKKKRKNQLSNPSHAQSRMGEKPQRNHKDSTFCLLFSEPQRAIELYNASPGRICHRIRNLPIRRSKMPFISTATMTLALLLTTVIW